MGEWEYIYFLLDGWDIDSEAYDDWGPEPLEWYDA